MRLNRSYPRVCLLFGSFLLTLSAWSQELNFSVEEAPEWTELFHRTEGWFGADGIFSIGLDGNDQNDGTEKTMIIFSDSFIGKVTNGAPEPGYTMVNNTIAYFNGTEAGEEHLSIQYNTDKTGTPVSYFVPDNPNAKEGQHFWLGDAFFNQELDNTLYIFAYHVEWTGDNVFDFIEPNVSLIAVPAGDTPPFLQQRQITTPLHIENPKYGDGNFGAGIYVNTKWAGAANPDGYIYIYGCIGQDKNVVIARVLPRHFEDFDQWRYWSGEVWSESIEDIVPVVNAASNELSVTQLSDGRYLMVFQVLGLSEKVGIRIGETPYGPFGDITEIYRTPEIDEGIYPYNAKAHPALSAPGELLISYNTITPDFWNDIAKDAHIYRPRFIKMILDTK